MDNIKVYKMNDYEWIASKWNVEETNAWYNKNIDDNDINEVRECDLDKEGMWVETTDAEDINRLGGAEEISGIKVVDGIITGGKTHFGDLMRMGMEVYKFVPLRESIRECGDIEEPFYLATTE